MTVVSFIVSSVKRLSGFFLKQGIATACNVLYGLYCVRALSLPGYAKYAIVFGFMGTVTVLTDSITTGTVAPLIGDRVDDHALLSDYLATSRRLMTYVFCSLAPLAMVGVMLALAPHGWGTFVDFQIVVAILLISWFSRVGGTYSSILFLLRDRKYFLKQQIIGSLASLCLLLLFGWFHAINIYVCFGLNLAQVIYQSSCYYFRTMSILGRHGAYRKHLRQQIVRLALPSTPAIVFYAMQGQILLLLLVVFGKSTDSIANLGALGRLGQILTFFSVLNPAFVEPFFARIKSYEVKRHYVLGAMVIAASMAGFSALGMKFPALFLWLLGPKYAELRTEAGLIILASAINFLAAYLNTVHQARRFVYWWSNVGNVVLILSIQIFSILRFDLSNLTILLWMNIATVSASLLIQILTGIYGFTFGPQSMMGGHPQTAMES